MKKNKGFTLIELLAVVIILSVIALIATPIVLNIIENSKKEALKDSAYGLINSARFYSYQYEVSDTVRFDIRDSVVTSNGKENISFQGKIENGIVLLNSSNEVAICVNEGNYSAYKNFKDNNVILVDNKNCDIPTGKSIVYLAGESTIKEYTNQELTEIVQKLESKNSELESRINELENNKKDTTPIGTVISYMASSQSPDGYLPCDGSVYNISDYLSLAEAIKTGFGSYNYYGGDGVTTFAVPDLRGEFLRGTGTNSHLEQGSGSNVGIHQDATSVPNLVLGWDNMLWISKNNINDNNQDGYNYNKIDSSSNINSNRIYFKPTSKASTTYNSASYVTTRPTNTSVLYCIKY